MVYEAAKTIRSRDIVLVGTGLPTVAAYLAQRTTAPGATFVYESGVVGAEPVDLPIGVGDFPLQYNAAAILGLYDVLGMVHSGRVTLGFLGGAQIDKYGNINSTQINTDGGVKWLTGSGGANDIASSAQRTVVIIKQERRRFKEVVDYCTSPGHCWKGKTRREYALPGGGPASVITDMAVFGFTCEGLMEVVSMHPGVTRDDLLDHMDFEPAWSDHVLVTPAPDSEVLQLIRDIDPTHTYVK